MKEVLPGIWHWTALRESIGNDVHSYYLTEERVVRDPMAPPERPDEFDNLLLAHGDPVIGTAREELATLVDA